MLGIKNNLMASSAARYLSSSYSSLSSSVERLSSGLRINSAKDDAAGLAVREMVRADVAQLDQASRNAQDGVSMLQAAEGAVGVMDDLLVRMKELAEQASTGSYSDAQRTIMSEEYNQLGDEITRIAQSTTFNGISLLDGSSDSVSFHIGSGAITFDTQTMTADTIAGGESIKSVSAKAQVYQSSTSVASTDDIYIAGGGSTTDLTKIGTGNGTAHTITLSAAGGDDISVDLSSYATDGVTLDELVDAINTAATSAGYTDSIASAEYDDASGGYVLQLTSTETGTGNGITFATAATNLTGFASAANFTETVAASNAGANDLTTAEGATAALETVAQAIETKDSYRAQLGYYMNRLDSATEVLDIQSENLSAAESRISDVDVATEMAAMTNAKVLAQAGVSMLAQANSMPEMALKLLQA
jgi:flagellin